MIVAKVVVNKSNYKLDKLFDYNIPNDLLNHNLLGLSVEVPFGRGNKTIDGYILKIEESTNSIKLKNIVKIKESKYQLSEMQIKLIFWMKKMYMCKYIDALNLITPNSIKKSIDYNYTLSLKEDNYELGLNKINKNAKKQIEAYNLIYEHKYYDLVKFKREFKFNKAQIEALEKKNLINISKEEKEFKFDLKEEKEKIIAYSKEQQDAINTIINCIEENKSDEFLIHGITGSGKTEIYIKIIKEVIKKGKKAILLVPEIALTYQTLNKFYTIFKDQIAIIHSNLKPKEKNLQWSRIKQNKANVIIGARSAVFAPVDDIGIIIMDEEHEYTFKSEQSPKYHTRDIARFYKKELNAVVVYGTATPSIETYYRVLKDEVKLIELKKRPTKYQLPNIEVVDMKDEIQSGNNGFLSQKLLISIKETLEKKQQVILFLNKRGFFTFSSCEDCGEIIKCRNCDISLTYHKTENALKCHYCGDKIRVIEKCPSCQSNNIKFKGYGTQNLENYIKNIFINYNVERLDIDNVNKVKYENIISKMNDNKIDILIGTQMVAKGLDFPNVTLVGIIEIDGLLSIPDFRSSEKTFQLITQVSGRAGRGDNKGNVIIQTFNKDHYAINSAIKMNFGDFFNKEINLREGFFYPPIYNMALINISAEKEIDLINTCNIIRKVIEYILIKNNICGDLKDSILGPEKSLIYKVNNMYRYKFIFKDVNISFGLIRKIIKYIFVNNREKYINKDIVISIDFNPYSVI